MGVGSEGGLWRVAPGSAPCAAGMCGQGALLLRLLPALLCAAHACVSRAWLAAAPRSLPLTGSAPARHRRRRLRQPQPVRRQRLLPGLQWLLGAGGWHGGRQGGWRSPGSEEGPHACGALLARSCWLPCAAVLWLIATHRPWPCFAAGHRRRSRRHRVRRRGCSDPSPPRNRQLAFRCAACLTRLLASPLQLRHQCLRRGVLFRWQPVADDRRSGGRPAAAGRTPQRPPPAAGAAGWGGPQLEPSRHAGG